MGPYGAVDLTFDDLEEDDARGAATALSALAKGLGSRLAVTLPGVNLTAPPKGPDLPRRHGAPVLGVLSKDVWRAAPGETVTLGLVLSNAGGALEGGIIVELAGAALEKGCVEPKSISAGGVEATFERKGNAASARLPGVKMPADLEIDRKVDKKAPRSPTMPLSLVLAGKEVGSALFTVRVLLASRSDRTGSAMVGRTLVVGPPG